MIPVLAPTTGGRGGLNAVYGFELGSGVEWHGMRSGRKEGKGERLTGGAGGHAAQQSGFVVGENAVLSSHMWSMSCEQCVH